MDCLVYPLRKLWISADYDDHGYHALDLGWWDSDPSMPEDSGRNPRLYAMADGIVLSIVNSHPDEPDWEGYGNYIIISYPRLGYCSLYAHIKKDSFMVRVGDKVSQLQPVCRMGNSGYSYGNHLHLEVCRGSSFVRHGGVDFIPIVYATDWHIVDPATQKDYNIRHMIIQPIDQNIAKTQLHVFGDDLRIRKAPSVTGEIVGFAQQGYYDVELISEDTDYVWANVDEYWLAANTDVSELTEASFLPVDENTAVNQIKITIDDLRIRLEPSTSSKILGYAPEGFYNVEDSSSESDYVWFKVCGVWVACVDGVEYHAASDDKDEQIKALEAEIDKLNGEINELHMDMESKREVIKSIRQICEDALN